MEVQTVTPSSVQSFGAIKRNTLAMTEDMFHSIKKMPAIDSFSKKYDSVVSMKPYVSKHNHKKVQLALYFSDIKPRNIIEKIYNKFHPAKINEVVLKTRATDEYSLYDELEKISSNRIIEIYDENK